MRKLATVTLAACLLLLAATSASSAPTAVTATAATPVTIQVLNVSDWHGNVDPVSNTGGAWNLSARWQEDRLAFPTLTLTAGDDFGASPPLSNFFDEVPGVKAERMMGIQVGTFGNHNFDRGIAHLQQMIDLAGAPTSADAPGQPYTYVSANLRNVKNNLTGVDPLRYFRIAGLKVAVIGITNEEAPTLVLPGNFGTIEVTDSVAAANKYAHIARTAGANVVMVITHKGVDGFTGTGEPFGELIDFASAVEGVDVIFGDHTNVQYSGTINGALVLENRSFGQTYAKTLVTAQPGKDGGVLAKSTSFVTPSAGALTNNGTQCPAPPAYCDQAIVDMLVPYRQELAEKLDEPVGTTTLPFDRGGNIERRQEVPLGDLIADGMRWRYGTQLGIMNGGGIRAQLPACSYQPQDHTLNRGNWNSTHDAVVTCAGYGSGTPYDIVLGDIFAVLPFGNVLHTRTVTGIQLWQALENGVSKFDSGGNNVQGRFPQISGFKFTFHYLNPSGCSGSETSPVTWSCVPSRVTSVSLDDGTPIPYDNTTYTLALPNFLNLGGDSYFMFNDGQGATQELDAAVMKEYMAFAGPSFDPTSYPLDRITKLP